MRRIFSEMSEAGKTKTRSLLILLFLIAIPVGAQVGRTISDLTELDASGITNPANVFVGVDNQNDSPATSKKVALDEIAKSIEVGISRDTVAAMLAETGVVDGQQCMTARYSTSHAVGDGSGGEYVYDADSTATIDGGFVMPGIGGSLSFSGTTFDGTAGTGRWLLKDQTIANAKQFGAIGNDAHDDTSALQRVFKNPHVYIPRGFYRVSSTITINPFPLWRSMRIRGDGAPVGDVRTGNVAIDKFAGSLICWNGADGGTLFDVKNTLGIHWEDIALAGKVTSAAGDRAGTLVQWNFITGGTGESIFDMLVMRDADNGMVFASTTGEGTCAGINFTKLVVEDLDTAIKINNSQGLNYNFWHISSERCDRVIHAVNGGNIHVETSNLRNSGNGDNYCFDFETIGTNTFANHLNHVRIETDDTKRLIRAVGVGSVVLDSFTDARSKATVTTPMFYTAGCEIVVRDSNLKSYSTATPTFEIRSHTGGQKGSVRCERVYFDQAVFDPAAWFSVPVVSNQVEVSVVDCYYGGTHTRIPSFANRPHTYPFRGQAQTVGAVSTSCQFAGETRGFSTVMRLPDDAQGTYEIITTGIDELGGRYNFKHVASVKHINGTTTLDGYVLRKKDASGGAVLPYISDGYDSLEVQVTGVASRTINWIVIMRPCDAAIRKELAGDLGNLGATATVDFDAGVSDGKYGVLTANTAITFSGTRPGEYWVKLTQDGTGGWNPTFPNIVNSPPTINATADAETLLRVLRDELGQFWCVAGAVDQIIVDTVAEMLALAGVPDGTRVDTARYSTSHAVGDGSGGEYVYDADSTATIDGGSILPGIAGTLSFAHPTGTAQAGASGQITLAAGASTTNDTYNNCWIVLTGGTGSGERALITDYNGTTKVATLSPDFSTTPDNTSTYEIMLPVFDGEAGTGRWLATTDKRTLQQFGGVADNFTSASDALHRLVLAVAAEGGGTAFVESGTYRLSREQVLPGTVALVGDNGAKFNCAGTFPELFRVASTSLASQRCGFENLYISGGASVTNIFNISAISISNRPLLKNIYVKDAVGDGIVLTECYGVTISDVYATTCGQDGIALLGCNAMVARNISATNNDRHGVRIANGGGSSGGCFVYGLQSELNDSNGLYVASTSPCVIDTAWCETNVADGIEVASGKLKIGFAYCNGPNASGARRAIRLTGTNPLVTIDTLRMATGGSSAFLAVQDDSTGGRAEINRYVDASAVSKDYVTTFADGDTTPSVTVGSTFKTANTSATTITFFDGGADGQEIKILLDPNTTVQNGSINLNGGTNLVAGSGGAYLTLKKSGVSSWKELARAKY